MTLSTKIEVFYGFYICSQWAFIHALLLRVPFALAGFSCYFTGQFIQSYSRSAPKNELTEIVAAECLKLTKSLTHTHAILTAISGQPVATDFQSSKEVLKLKVSQTGFTNGQRQSTERTLYGQDGREATKGVLPSSDNIPKLTNKQ